MAKKTYKLRVTGLYEGNPPMTGGFPSRRVNNAENVFIWWRHHVRVWAHKSHFIPPPCGRLIGSAANQFGEKWCCYNSTALCYFSDHCQAAWQFAFHKCSVSTDAGHALLGNKTPRTIGLSPVEPGQPETQVIVDKLVLLWHAVWEIRQHLSIWCNIRAFVQTNKHRTCRYMRAT